MSEQNQDQTIIERRNRKKKGKKRGLLLTLLLLLAASIIGVAGFTINKVNQTLDKTYAPEPVGTGSFASGDEDAGKHRPFSMIILGRDTRPDLGTMNTDVMMLAIVDMQEKNVHLLSLPRDLKVEVPGYSGVHKINSVFALGYLEEKRAERNHELVTETGTSLVKKTLSNQLGIPIDYYATIDFEGFKQVIDQLGGVDVYVDRNMRYHDPTDGTSINLQEGQQRLDGKNALDFVRFRQSDDGDNSSDFDRNGRQQAVIRALVDRLSSFDGMTKIYSVMDIVGDHVRRDIPNSLIKDLTFSFQDYGSDKIETIPNDAYWDSASQATVIPDERLAAIQQELKELMKLNR
ncbi:LCP family protein [Rubeoparvulum massiliense]|uniref:LCP family protein n=1 Tax=Rubeoparvulum massiliense TaxID=1631346 RepID=UPI00065DD1F8|nr:LCP family protein [Rubeoparvulum massiliense]